MSKPLLYHGTPVSAITKLTPVESHPGSEPLVFATPDLLCAIAYSLKPNSTKEMVEAHQKGIELSHAQLYDLKIYTGENIPPFMVFCAKGNAEDKFKSHVQGNILSVCNDDFQPMNSQAKTCEWCSDQEVDVDSSFSITANEAMKYGVQIFLSNDPELFMQKQAEASKRLREGNFDMVKFWSDFYKNGVAEGWLIHQNKVLELNPISFENGNLPNDSFVKSPSSIIERFHAVPSGTVKAFSGKFEQLASKTTELQNGQF